MDAQRPRFLIERPDDPDLFVPIYVFAVGHARITPAALGFWLWATATIESGTLLEEAHRRFGLDAGEVAILVGELVAGDVLEPGTAIGGSNLNARVRS